jgi:aminopeptidase N
VEYRSQQSQSELKEINLQQGLTDMDSKSSYLGTAYQGGENFWYQLEEELGEEKVLQVLRTYLATYRFQTATTEDLRWIISQQSTTPLESFFERWFTTR